MPGYLVCEACLEGEHEECLGEGCACRQCKDPDDPARIQREMGWDRPISDIIADL